MMQPLHALSPHILKVDKTMQRVTTTSMPPSASLPLPILGMIIAFNKLDIARSRNPTKHGADKPAHRYVYISCGSDLLPLGAAHGCMLGIFHAHT